MNTHRNTHTTRKNNIRRLSLLLMVALIIAGSLGFAANGSASAQSGVYNDGKGCQYWNANGRQYGLCYRAATSTWGYLWTYIQGVQNYWLKAGIYDATYDYYYNFNGGYFARMERSSGAVTYPTGCGWLPAGYRCTTSAPTFTIGGTTAPTNPLLAGANSRIIDSWLSPSCTASYNGC